MRNAFAFSCHGKCMGNLALAISHWPSHWPSSHLTISINQCLFMSNVFAISSHQEMHGYCHIAHHICLFIISPSTCHFIAQTLLHGVNDIWTHIWAKNIFSQLSFLKSHTSKFFWKVESFRTLGQYHKGTLVGNTNEAKEQTSYGCVNFSHYPHQRCYCMEDVM
jgi:hypothetical protein